MHTSWRVSRVPVYAGIHQGTLNDAYIMKGAMLRDAGELGWTPFFG